MGRTSRTKTAGAAYFVSQRSRACMCRSAEEYASFELGCEICGSSIELSTCLETISYRPRNALCSHWLERGRQILVCGRLDDADTGWGAAPAPARLRPRLLPRVAHPHRY